MKKMNYKLFAAFALAGALVSCDETNPLGENGEVEAALGELYITAESAASRLFGNVDFVLRNPPASTSDSIAINGAWAKMDPNNSNEYFIDYGNGTAGSDGVMRKGEIRFSLTGNSYLDQNANVSVSLTDYEEGDMPIGGSIAITNNGQTNGNDNFSFAVTNFTVEDAEGNPLSFNATKDFVWEAGSATPSDASDDRYTISGTSSGSSLGNTISTTVDMTEKLVIDNTCSYRMVEGILSLSLTGDSLVFDSGSIDFKSADGCAGFFDIELENTAESRVVTLTNRAFQGF